MKIKKRALMMLLSVILLFSNTVVFADGTKDTEIKKGFDIKSIFSGENKKEILILGDEIKPEQVDQLKKEFGIEGKNINTIYINIQEERDALSDYLPQNVIGNKSLSAAHVKLISGKEIKVKTNNINWITEDMYRSALSTAGIEGAEIYINAPFPVTGTAALTGIIKAYEQLTNTIIDEEQKDIANEEMVTTAELSDNIGIDKANDVMLEVKKNLIEDKLKDPDEIRDTVVNVAEINQVTLTDTQIDNIVKAMQGVSKLNLTMNQVKGQLGDLIMNIDTNAAKDGINNVMNKIDGIEENQEKAKGFISKLIEKITSFFSKKESI